MIPQVELTSPMDLTVETQVFITTSLWQLMVSSPNRT